MSSGEDPGRGEDGGPAVVVRLHVQGPRDRHLPGEGGGGGGGDGDDGGEGGGGGGRWRWWRRGR